MGMLLKYLLFFYVIRLRTGTTEGMVRLLHVISLQNVGTYVNERYTRNHTPGIIFT